MKRKLYFISLLFAALAVTAGCKEGALRSAGPDKNIFLEPYGIDGEQLELQKNFFAETNCYLLYHDLLDRVYIGRDAQGEEIYQDVMIDLTYAMLSSTRDKFEFDYLATMDEKRAAADFIKEKLLPSLAEDIRPYSFFLVNKIDHYEMESGKYLLRTPPVYAGWRSTAVAMEGVDEMTEQEQTAYKMMLLKSIVNRIIKNVDQAVFDDFYAVSGKYYGNYTFDPVSDYPELALADIRETGMLSAWGYYAPGDSWPDGFVNFKAKENDREDYINLFFSKTEDEVEAENAGFPLVIQKYHLLKAAIAEIGVTL